MPPVFGRTHPDPHPYDDALKAWLTSADASWQSMARNVMHDHRVSEARAEAFDRFVDSPCTSAGLNRAIIDYFEEQIRHRRLPHYVYKAVNEENLLTSGQPVPLIHKDVKLVRVLDLNGLRFVVQWGNEPTRRKSTWEPTLANFPYSLTDSEVANWLDDEIGAGSPDRIERAVSTILDILNSYTIEEEPYQPTWATTWAAFEPHENGGPERWLQVSGVATPPPRWLILLRYTVAEAGTLARPTILDADWYAYHFPSPPQTSLAVGGHPMDLRVTPRATHLLPEYIHKQIPHKLEHWTDLGGKIARTNSPYSTGLVDQRMAHFELLVNIYGQDVLNWMNSPI